MNQKNKQVKKEGSEALVRRRVQGIPGNDKAVEVNSDRKTLRLIKGMGNDSQRA